MQTAGRLLCPDFVLLPPPLLQGSEPVELGKVNFADHKLPAAWWRCPPAHAKLLEADRPMNIQSWCVTSATPTLDVSVALWVSQAQQLSRCISVSLCRMFHSAYSCQEIFGRQSRALCRIPFPSACLAQQHRSAVKWRSVIQRGWDLVL